MSQVTLKEKRDKLMQVWADELKAFEENNLDARFKAAIVIAQDVLPYIGSLYQDKHLQIAYEYTVKINVSFADEGIFDKPEAVFTYLKELKWFLEAAASVTNVMLHEKFPLQMKRSNELFEKLDNSVPQKFD